MHNIITYDACYNPQLDIIIISRYILSSDTIKIQFILLKNRNNGYIIIII